MELTLVTIGKIIFYICMTPLIIYSAKYFFFGFSSLFVKEKKSRFSGNGHLPTVSINIPVYNDPIVVECIKSCLQFDYPKEKYDVLVADDSNDETVALLEKLHKETNQGFKIIRRGERKGFKAGALNEALKHSKGDIVVIFDSDYILDAGFLKEIVAPFADEKVGFVQTRWDYTNPDKNRVSRLAMTSYTAFHMCSMPVEEKIGTAIFCGTGGAMRRKLLQSIGGWNEKSIAEDLDVTIRMLKSGYKQVYLPHVKAKGEVPSTLASYVKQQQRWAYGTTMVMKEQLMKIFRSNMSRRQKFDMFFLTSGFLVFPFILGVTISTLFVMSAWFGPNTAGNLFNAAELTKSISLAMSDLSSLDGLALLILSSGYIFECAIALIKQKRYRDLTIIPYIFVVGLVVQVTNTVAVIKAMFGMKHSFYRTPKMFYNGGGE